jgi:protein-disulfide isomerase
MSRLALPVSERDHVKGSLDVPVILVEYGDYECPYCGQAYVFLQEVEQAMGDAMGFVFRNFPLTTMHPHAQHAAEAAEAAGAQGAFWEMHDTLYEHQDTLDDASLMEYAVQLGLDLQQFSRDLLEHRFAPRVREDFLSGVRSGVNGTPTFFINGLRYDGPYDSGSLVAALQHAATEKVR